MLYLILAFLALFGLKQGGVIDWSWWAVTSPLLLAAAWFITASVVAVLLVRQSRKLVVRHWAAVKAERYSRTAKEKGIV